jgi:hypothetical protein
MLAANGVFWLWFAWRDVTIGETADDDKDGECVGAIVNGGTVIDLTFC